MALQADSISDLITLTLKDLGRGNWTMLATDLQEYVILPQILKQERVIFDGGYGHQFNIMTATSGAAANVGLFKVDTVNVNDVMTTGTAPWRHTTVNYAFDEREIKMNSGAAQIVNLIKVRRADGMTDLAKKMETNGWSKPVDSTNTTDPFGIPYWIVKNNTTGFNGGAPTGFTGGAAGVSSTTYTAWANYTAQYTNVTKADFVAKVRKALTFTNFKPPIEVPQYNTGSRYMLATNYSVIGACETLAEQQNDNLGNDVASKDGQVMIRRTPLTWVPKLESDTTNPIYGINWGVFKVAFLQGEYLNETGPIMAPNQHRTRQVHVDLTYNFVCYDRRQNFVIATGT